MPAFVKHGSAVRPVLVKPCAAYLASYIDACRETWGHAYSNYILHDPAQVDAWRHTLFDDYARAERGEGLPPGFVPSRTLWFVAQSTNRTIEQSNNRTIPTATYLGTVNIRLRMTEALKNGGGTVGFILRTSARGRHLAGPLACAAIRAARALVEGPVYVNTERVVPLLDRLHAEGVCPYVQREICTCTIDGAPRELVRFMY